MIRQILESTIFIKYFNGSFDDLEKRWNEPHRYFHTLTHLEKIINLIDRDKNKVMKWQYDMLRVAAIYHDIVYLPREDKYNVTESIDKFKEDFTKLPQFYSYPIIKIIESTNYHNFEDEDKIIRMFNSYDMNGILNGSLEELIEDGDNIAKEYHLDKEVFKEKRIEFLEKYKEYNSNVKKCIDYLKNL